MASSTYFALSSNLRNRIDNAYITICRSLPDFQEPPLKKRKLNSPGSGGGGFIIEDLDVADEIDVSQLPNIPISHVPTGLQLLDLAPDDEQVLAVFRQAASGWDDTVEMAHSEQSQVVSFDDWRAVCGILLEHHAEEYADSSDGEAGANSRAMDIGDFEQHNSDRGGDDYEVDDEDNASDDDYVDESVPRQRRTRGKKKMESETDSDSDSGRGSRYETCLETFALFFEDATPEELLSKRIMISDVQRVAKLLKEKLKAEEIVEMLEIFSTSPDKSLNLADFEQMMMVARLV
ncbi:hypothetical protein BDZ89DRAFT_1098921 [Hymenopellis radicata]|nr:hypothetical protein BDZ89DRAFT_1098921 [Hymenopellis radicata]